MNNKSTFPLTLTQMDIYLDQVKYQGSPLYNVGGYIRLTEVELEKLSCAHAQLVSQFELFGLRIVDTDSGVAQSLGNEVDSHLPFHDFSEHDNALELAEQWVSKLFQTPIEYMNAPLFRAALIKIKEGSYWYVGFAHHLMADGWGFSNWARQLGKIYNEEFDAQGAQGSWKEISDADEKYKQSKKYSADQTYWSNQLKHHPEQVFAPSYQTQFAKANLARSQRKTVAIETRLFKQLTALAADLSVTLPQLFMAAVTLYISKVYKKNRLVLGVPYHNRKTHKQKQMIGVFTSVSPLAIEVSSGATVADVVREIADCQKSSLRHQRYPIGHISNDLSETGFSGEIYDIGFNFLKFDSQLEIEGHEADLVYVSHQHESTPLMVNVWDYGQEQLLELQLDYNLAYFNELDISLLELRLLHLLEQISQIGLDNKIAEIDVMPQSEQKDILVNWNDTTVSYDSEQTFNQLFEQQVESHPDKVATRFNQEALTYKELNHKANQLAHYLQSQGVQAGTLVGVSVARSNQMIVSLLAVAKAGATYVPLDLDYPNDRLAYMVEHSGLKIVLADNEERIQFDCTGLIVISLENQDTQKIILSQAITDLSVSDSSNQSAYIIYTSGSTGKPKGVEVGHKAVSNFLRSMAVKPGLNHTDRLLAVTSISFDIHVLELFLPLCTGAELVVCPQSSVRDGSALRSLIEMYDITVMQATPATWRMLLAAPSWGGAKGLKALCGGEALNSELADTLLENVSELWNMYGPTETTVWSSCDKVTNAEQISIGQPINNTEFYILDTDMKPVPIGAYGELYIGGQGVSNGYFKQPELTKERFIAASVAENKIIYQTGDLARWTSDGKVECGGRIDDQVKVRGYRIELAEIESQLAQLDVVSSAVVNACTVNGQQQLAAYVVVNNQIDAQYKSISKYLRSSLNACLPHYMVPSFYVSIPEVPLTPNGKVDKKALPEIDVSAQLHEQYEAPKGAIEQQLCGIWQEVLQVEKVGVSDSFFDLGGNSLLYGKVQTLITQKTPYQVSLVDMFEHTTIEQLARFIGEKPSQGEVESDCQLDTSDFIQDDIAIIGLAGRFPGAKDVNSFWENIVQGKESLSTFSDEELLAAGVEESLINNPNYVKKGVVLENVKEFDADFFHFTPREAEILDPQHRLLLECAVEALEMGGYGDLAQPQNVGVHVGVGVNTYLFKNVMSSSDVFGPDRMAYFQSNERDFPATRLSYKLNLTGPSTNISTACSTSLVAIHQACMSLMRGECSMALAGASRLSLFEAEGYVYQEGAINSKDGHCRAFDQNASGTRWGDGAGLVLLKPLQKALADKDTIHAVIKGSAINNDGGDKAGFTAPSIKGQSKVIRSALKFAGVSASDIGYVEAHGTGTVVGDPIEIKALSDAFGVSTAERCALGAVKSNIGHLDAAAGIAGVIKTVMALKNKQLPPTINFETANPMIDFENTPFYVNTEVKDWDDLGKPRRAGISSFGIGGTNAHVILEEAPEPERDTADSKELIVLSAMSENTLQDQIENLADYLSNADSESLSDIAHTLSNGRTGFRHRISLVAQSISDAHQQLTKLDAAKGYQLEQPKKRTANVFMFSGQGSQHLAMGKGLYEQQAIFRASFDQCAELIKEEIGEDIRDCIFSEDPDASSKLSQTLIAQPALFAVEFAIVKLLESWGIKPDLMIGHSLGEYVAACIASVLSVKESVKLVCARAKLMQGAEAGRMLSVAVSAESIASLIKTTGCDLAAINGSALCTVAGEALNIQRLSDALAEREIEYRPLVTSHAFHSRMMDGILDAFKAVVSELSFQPPTVKYVSNVTGQYISADEVMSADYWVKHLRGTVQFFNGVEHIINDEAFVSNTLNFIEIGPGNALSSMVRKNSSSKNCNIFNSMRHPKAAGDDDSVILKLLGKLWESGTELNWQKVQNEGTRYRIALPTYPFERHTYWLERNTTQHKQGTAINQKSPIASWFYASQWQSQKALVETTALSNASKQWLLFADTKGVAKKLADQLSAQGHNVTLVFAGNETQRLSDNQFTVDIGSDYDALFEIFANSHCTFDHIAHLWSLDLDFEQSELDFDTCQTLTTYSLLGITQSLVKHQPENNTVLDVITSHVYRVAGYEDIRPALAPVVGLCKTISQEFTQIHCHLIDISMVSFVHTCATASVADWCAGQLEVEFKQAERVPTVAIRLGNRWVERFESYQLQKHAAQNTRLRDSGVYLITGGLGKMGLALAEYISSKQQGVHIAFVSRTQFPARDEWSSLTDASSDSSQFKEQILRLEALEKMGSSVSTHCASVDDLERMTQVFERVESQFGAVNGVIHCAGKLHGAMASLQSMSTESFREQYQSKVKGVLVLDALLNGKSIDFCLLMSSLSSQLGGLGYGAYASANIFMDVFTNYLHSTGNHKWTAINWDAWTFEGEDYSNALVDNYAMSVSEGQAAFEKILTLGFVPQVINSTGSLQARLKVWGEEPQSTDKKRYSRPKKSGKYVKPSNSVTEKLAAHWSELLGIEHVGEKDNFFDLGGDSLLATRALSMLKRDFPESGKDLSIQCFFEQPEIELLAAKLTDNLMQQQLSEKKEQLKQDGIEVEEGTF
ncbi:hypothetical protein N474_22250 [Pseudoalteromonas luteoviolacea CPMOR-2]|uniref:non-ribosomal peptide synthetase/type I polyketide synthase n=1 Tax=Pseudoalteromonas luteoviolacea TaxID=43657 RepID=UPI0007B08570|nr:non-ribosomal peptide synthetase/type I polyketide synthase [Pseudoalteromonas luteoviolacea]KZN53059.1 hypothetical protein N474_22250 [Pseudoalteromonas luteoviolacea CPMOR-2]